ncbi:MAG: MotA/TolQ/ExbB proton channel family protein [Verrucomicrobia bacterium]|nr:MotA/TolQ/ExbB proton channel family protein [Verrucomicrobiota bacterium]
MSRVIRMAGVVLAVWLVVSGMQALAQEATAAVPVESGTSLWKTLKTGGPLMVPLGLLSVATIALGVFGFLTVRESKMLTPHLLPPLEIAIDNLQVNEAMTICQGSPSMLTNILNAGLLRIRDGYLDMPSMEKAMEEASLEETSAGLKLISYLSIVAQLSPMVGLLGTVSGMIKAFDKIGKGAMGRPELLAGNIGEALITTATGLLIGIPAMFLYFHLKGRYTANVTRLGRVLGNLSHRLVVASRAKADADVPAGDPA